MDRGSNLFHFVMIKPSHYDDDGYPIQWIRSFVPSNTLASLNGLAEKRAGGRCSGKMSKFACTLLTRPIGACGQTASFV